MKNYQLTVTVGTEIRKFELAEYMFHDEERCIYHVFEDGILLAAFVPDHYHSMQLCKNPDHLDDELIDLLADSLESHIPPLPNSTGIDNLKSDLP